MIWYYLTAGCGFNDLNELFFYRSIGETSFNLAQNIDKWERFQTASSLIFALFISTGLWALWRGFRRTGWAFLLWLCWWRFLDWLIHIFHLRIVILAAKRRLLFTIFAPFGLVGVLPRQTLSRLDRLNICRFCSQIINYFAHIWWIICSHLVNDLRKTAIRKL